MRWKLLVLASVAAPVLGIGLWSLFAIVFFGTARELARHDLILLTSALLPLALIIYAGIFVYRHTARRRKTQAVMTIFVSLLIAPLIYFGASSLLPGRLSMPRTYDLRHAR